jgi:hypothetical protein
MSNRFKRFETIEIEGFEIPIYKSLLAGERIEILEARKRCFDVTLQVLNLKKKLYLELGVDTDEELQEKVKSLGDDNYEGENKEYVVNLLAEFQNINDPDELNRKFAEESITLFLSSRVDPEWFASVAPELKEAFPFDYSEKEIKDYCKIGRTERLGHPLITGIYKRLIRALPDSTFLKLSNLIDAEIEGKSLEDYEAQIKADEEPLHPKA